jgi:oligopeptide transport system substrate-binding protein
MSRKKFVSRKKFIALSGSVAAAGVLAACGDTPTNTAVSTTAPAATTAASTATTAAATATTAAPAATTAATTATTAAATATTAAATATTAAANATTAASVARTGGTFRWRQPSEPKTMDPGFMTDTISINTAENLYEGLYEYNPQGQLVAAAATGMPQISADGLTYTIKMKSGLKFSNGDPLTAKDYVYAWNRVAQLGAKAEYGFLMYPVVGFAEVYDEKDDAKRQAGTISGVKAVDDTTIEIKLKQAASYFTSSLGLWTFWPVSQKVVEGNGNKFDEKNPWSSDPAKFVGNGPFTLKEWKRDVSMRFEVNPNYVGEKPGIDVATVEFIKEDATARLKFDNGELDDVIVPVSDIQKLKRDAKYKDSYKEYPQARVTWLAFNMDPAKPNPFNKSKALRQAIWHGIDRQLITEGALQGSGIPATSLLPAGVPGPKAMNMYPFDLNKAKTLLKEAGYDTPEKLKALADEINNFGGGKSGGIAFNADTSANKAWCENVQQQLKTNLGLDIKLNPVATFAEFLKRRDEDKEFILYRGSWGADFLDAQNFYEPLFVSTSGTNQSNYKNPKYDEIVKKGNTGKTDTERNEAYNQAEMILQEDAAYVPLFSGIEVRLIRPTVTNWGYDAKGPAQLKYVRITK